MSTTTQFHNPVIGQVTKDSFVNSKGANVAVIRKVYAQKANIGSLTVGTINGQPPPDMTPADRIDSYTL